MRAEHKIARFDQYTTFVADTVPGAMCNFFDQMKDEGFDDATATAAMFRYMDQLINTAACHLFSDENGE